MRFSTRTGWIVSPEFQVFSILRLLSTPFNFARTLAAALAVLFLPASPVLPAFRSLFFAFLLRPVLPSTGLRTQSTWCTSFVGVEGHAVPGAFIIGRMLAPSPARINSNLSVHCGAAASSSCAFSITSKMDSGGCAPETAWRRLKMKKGTPSTPSDRAC